MKKFIHEEARRSTKRIIIIGFLLTIGIISVVSINRKNETSVPSQSIENEIDSAVYRREEFFGSKAIVPIPTAEAYENLLKLTGTDNPNVFAKLAEVCEKLEKFDEAENYFIKAGNLDNLAKFYNSRGNYEKSAEVQAEILKLSKRFDVFERLINFAQIHEIDKYLQPEYFQQAAENSDDTLPIIEKLIDKLVGENQNAKALEIIRNYKPKFPEIMLEKEVPLLSPKEAEALYYQSFNPFWSESEATNFYDFLSSNERLRAYGSELKTKFRQNPADYETAIRLIHYKQYDYNEITPTVLQLEKAKKDWKADELLTIARLLLKEGNGDLASKFLYTLQVRNEFTPEIRGKIAYQIFKILCDAGNENLSLTKGNLDFYRDIASADAHPGITTGILSLIFSDTRPRFELERNEQTATKLFNRAAAYRVFQNYKNEFPNSPEIGQMYLDLIRIYTEAKDTELAEKFLNEFSENYEKSSDFLRVAMNLADAFVIAKNAEKERQVYQKVLNFLGKKGRFFSTKKAVEKEKDNESTSYDNSEGRYADSFVKQSEQITYNTVLSRYVQSFSIEKKVSEIPELYSNEIAKYPEQEWLYEQRATWLEQTNLFDEQLKTYKATLEKFPTNNWRDKLARWFIRNKKQDEFEQYSADLVEKLNDAEIESYLSQFVDGKASTDDFGKQLYLKLYQTAHQRFPHNISFVNKLLTFYRENKRDEDWRNLASEYYFESSQVREEFLNELGRKGELQNYLAQANGENIINELFRADVNLRLSRYEEALQSYRKLNAIYPNEREFSDRLVNLTRSFGQKDRQILTESAKFARQRAEFEVSNANYRTTSGEINAELNDYKTARSEWQKLIATGKGSSEVYLETASVFWDYFQYEDALQTIKDYRLKSENETIYAFEAGAALESLNKNDEAISEYLIALENDETGKVRRRLETLANDKGLFNQINAVFQKQRKTDEMTLAYAEFLRKIEKTEQAENLLLQQISNSKDVNFLESAEGFSDDVKPRALNRLAAISTTPRKSISYRLRLADFYRENKQPNQAKQVLVKLQQQHPTNYGVLTENADFYWSLGANEAAINILQSGLERAKGNYRFAFASRLAKRLISLNRLSEAERFLVGLHQERPTDSAVFHELANVFVSENKPNELRQKFVETVKAIKSQEIEPNESETQVSDMRRQMITSFTQLKDYRAAVEQHIEIINRKPDDEENVDAAIRYVKRYGNADLLLNYYQKTADEAFKNYRWNVVLAKVFEANGDAENAVKNYHKAIDNQPEMTELYADLVRIEKNRRNYAEALKNLDQIIELSGEDKNLIKQKVQLLQFLGRNDEAKSELAKIPAEIKPIIKPENQFSEAEKAKSIEMFRSAFSKLLENPLENELKAENITSYVNTLRQEENLDVITERLFSLRAKLISESERRDSKLAGEARNRLQILQNAMSQSVGNIAKTVGTDEELEKLHSNLSQRIDEVSKDEQNGTLTFLQDFSVRSGFGDLVEKVLIKRGNQQSLTDFYNERGAFQKVLEIAESENNLPLIAENAKLLGEREKELNALRQIFQDKNASQINVLRYLQIVDRSELEALSKQNSPHQLELVNFLLGKGEKELAHQAIENSYFQKSWKLARHAETSLALKEFDETNECYFCDALTFGSIGDLISDQPDKKQHLIGKDWFRLSREYGEWLDAKKESDSDKFLVAMTENLPKDAGEQMKLGEYYLAKNELEKANVHISIARELDESNIYSLADWCKVLWSQGEKEKANTYLDELLNAGQWLYLDTMVELGLTKQAHTKLLPVLINKLNNDEDIEEIIYKLAKSFDSEKEKADYFYELASKGKENSVILQKIIQSELVAKEFRQPFYERMLSKMKDDLRDYEFEEISRRTFSTEDAEEIYDHEKDFADSQRERNDKFTFEFDYLEFLLENGKTGEAKRLVLQIENEMKGKFPRPFALRLKHFQLFGGNLQKLGGIQVTDNITEIKPPSIERLNEVVKLLNELKRETEAEKLKLAFYARMIELENVISANFTGLARAYFKLGDKENALKTLQSLSETENFNDYKILAEIFTEFGFLDKAIESRRKLIEINPNDFGNILDLAQLLPKENAVSILNSLVSDRNTPRILCWAAIWKLHKLGELSEFPNYSFDSYSQFYNGNFLNSMILDKDIETQQLQQLIRFYAAFDKPFAALKLAELDKSEKTDELLYLLSKTAEKVNEFQKAIEFEKAKSKVDEAKIKELQNAEIEKNKRITDFTVDAENTRKL